MKYKNTARAILLVAITLIIGCSLSACKKETYTDTVRKKYEQVSENLEQKMFDINYYSVLDNRQITQLVFNDDNAETTLKVFYEGEDPIRNNKPVFGYALFDISTEHYQNLISAKQQNNMLYYLDALNNIFDEMSLIENPMSQEVIPMTLPEDTPENIEKVMDMFAIEDEVKPDGVIRQIGFMPYHIEVANFTYDEDTVIRKYSYKISGISYCEVNEESSYSVEQSDKLIIESDYKNKNIKAYNREFIYSSSIEAPRGFDINVRIMYDIRLMIISEKDPYTIETTYLKEVSLMDEYNKMKKGDFNFEEPDGFDLNAYLKAEKENQKDTQPEHR